MFSGWASLAEFFERIEVRDEGRIRITKRERKMVLFSGLDQRKNRRTLKLTETEKERRNEEEEQEARHDVSEQGSEREDSSRCDDKPSMFVDRRIFDLSSSCRFSVHVVSRLLLFFFVSSLFFYSSELQRLLFFLWSKPLSNLLFVSWFLSFFLFPFSDCQAYGEQRWRLRAR